MYKYDSNLNLVATLALPSAVKEGWGMTHDSNYIYVTNGSPYIYVINPSTFTVRSTIYVTNSNNQGVSNLNEIELVNGYIYAN